MNSIVIMSFISFTAFLTAVVVLFYARTKIGLTNRVYIPMVASLLLYTMIASSNVFEHSGITDIIDPIEDLAEVLFNLLFLFFIYSWKNVQSEERFMQLFRRAPVPFAEVTRSGEIVQVNELMEKELESGFGLKRQGQVTLDQWWRNAFHDTETYHKTINEWSEAVAQSFSTGSVVKPLQREMYHEDGKVHSKIISGSCIGRNMLLSLIDITEQKVAEAEKEKLYQQLMQSQKLEAIGTLAGGMAHDFNNILGAIMGYADMLLVDLPDDSPMRSDIQKIIDAAQRSASLSRQLLVFARKQRVKTELVDVNHAVQNMLTMLQRLLGENIILSWIPFAVEEECLIKIDPVQLDQILVNLCVNARDAIKDVGKISITIDSVDFDEHMCRMYVDSKVGSYVRITVSDNGCGMDEETRKRIFEPFFTTKGAGVGTGLGLAMIYGIMKQAGGFVSCYSEVGTGTRFDLYFPNSKSSSKSEKSAAQNAIPPGNGETILLVEDDPVILEMSTNMLTILGYRVLPAASPLIALSIVRDKKQNIDLVLTDVIMPEMNGRELYNELLKIKPALKCLFMSGYTADVIIPRGVLSDDQLLIQKPFSRADIAPRIRKALGAEDAASDSEQQT